MCGIVGYVGKRGTADVLLDGLQRLEYRGYDSAGIAMLPEQAGKAVDCVKSVGKVAALAKLAKTFPELMKRSSAGIAHTRWATHGAPTTPNAHPHCDNSMRFAVVHNGIIDNYLDLRKYLTEKGHKFVSETDSEVIAHLLDECYQGDLMAAMAAAVKQLAGTYGIAAICADRPGEIVAARSGSPIVIGVGDKENLVASDVAALLSYTRQVIYLDDGDLALLTADKIDLRNVQNVPVEREIARIDWDVSAAEKGDFAHFMLKEIFEQPDSIANGIRGRLDLKMGNAIFSGLGLSPQELARVNRIIITGCGSSLHAAMVGEYFFEDIAGIPTEVAQAAEFRYRNPIIEPDTLVLAISQSGETADTLAAVREAKTKGAVVGAICNVVGSTIARESGRGIYLHAGPEISVASTKAFTSQVSILLMLSLLFARNRRLDRYNGEKLAEAVSALPSQLRKVLEQTGNIKKLAEKYAFADNFFYIGRGNLYPTALEGALKLKEISYIHAEGYHAAELKHGPIALLDEKCPVVALANDVPGRDKILGNIQECLARRSPVVAVITEGDTEICKLGCETIEVPQSSKFTAPLITAVALQLFAYFVAVKRGCEVDQPRNLAKSVTVE